MKVLLSGLLLSGVFVLSACGSDDVEEVSGDSTPVEEVTRPPLSDAAKQVLEAGKENEPTQEELNVKLKEEATQADFVELNVDNPPIDKKVFAAGTITFVNDSGLGGTFTLTTEEEKGIGIYTIFNLTSDFEVQEGQYVTIYGTVSPDKSEDGSPQITATIIENTEEQAQEPPTLEPKEEPVVNEQAATTTFINPFTELDDRTAADSIKAKANEDWPDDFKMQDFQIQEQTKAFENLKRINVTSDVEQQQLEKALSDWGSDYIMAEFQYEEQMKAYNN